MKGVTVHDGAIVAADAVVTKDGAPYDIVGGIPATLINWRHPASLTTRLQALAWWDWGHEVLREALPDFRSLPVDAFLEKYENLECPAAVMRPLQSLD